MLIDIFERKQIASLSDDRTPSTSLTVFRGDRVKVSFSLCEKKNSGAFGGDKYREIEIPSNVGFIVSIGNVSGVYTFQIPSEEISDIPKSEVRIEQIITGSSSTNEVHRISISPEPIRGSFVLSRNGSSSGQIKVDASASDVDLALSSIASLSTTNVLTGLTTRNYSVSKIDSMVWDITFINNLSNTPVGLLSVDDAGLISHIGKIAEINLSTADAISKINAFLADSPEKDGVIEIEANLSGKYYTLLQNKCTIKKDVIEHSPSGHVFDAWTTGLTDPSPTAVLFDGLPNLVRYALGMTPNASDPTKVPVTGSSGGDITYTFRRWVNDVNYIVEHSTDLTTWTVAESFLAVDFTAEETITVSRPSPSYFRLKVVTVD